MGSETSSSSRADAAARRQAPTKYELVINLVVPFLAAIIAFYTF
jgi:hypothetical protein